VQLRAKVVWHGRDDREAAHPFPGR
jgi:hypothetical protein